MRVPRDAAIPDEKLTEYLLKLRERNDKSQYLEQAGFTAENPEDLRNAIRQHAAMHEAVEDGRSAYGIFYRVEGELVGPAGRTLPVITIWLEDYTDKQFRFVTLKPHQEKRE